MTASELTELAARVEAGSGEDNWLEHDIAIALGWTVEPQLISPDHDPRYTSRAAPQRWTSSLDAVVALIAERLPGRRTFLQNPDGYIRGVYQGERRAVVFFDPPSPYSSAMSDEDIVGVASSPARAMLAATLRALAAQQQDRPKEPE